MEYKIVVGRKVDGNLDIKVPDTFNKVSRKHLEITINEGDVLLTDLESSNGTYVNGKRVSKCKVKADDEILLGAKNGEGYKLNFNEILDDIKDVELQSKTDFVEEFQKLKFVYKAYNNEIESAKRKLQLKNAMPKIVISVLIGLILLVLQVTKAIPPEASTYTYPLMLIIMSGAGIMSFAGGKPDLKEIQTDIELKYQKQYICPKCKKPYNINTHWKKIENNKTCPHNCGAVFSKD
jgi:hypothetical protein